MTAGRGIVLVLLVCAACVHRGRVVETACTNRVLDEAVGPEGGTKAVVFERRCTAPLGFTTQVALTGADMRLSDRPGNVFVAWQDDRLGNDDVFFTTSFDGGGTFAPAERVDDSGTGTSEQSRPALALARRGIRRLCYVVWEDDRNGTSDIYLARRGCGAS